MEVEARKNRDWVHLKNCKEQFRRFFLDSEAGVFVLKGPHGSGKTFFVRNSVIGTKESIRRCEDEIPILREKRFSRKLAFTSRVSLFGVRDLAALEETAMGALKVSGKGPKAKSIDKGFKAASKALKPFLGGVDVEIPLRSVFWAVASNLGFVLILDDIDRKGDDLKLEEVLGFANALSEQAEGRTKVILVIDEDRIKVDERSEWETHREKFLDYGFTFRPSPRELANCYVKSDALYEVIGDIFDALEWRNIRAMRKVERFVLNLRKFLAERKLSGFPEPPYEEAAKYATLFLRAGREFDVESLPGSEKGFDVAAFFGLREGGESEAREERKQAFESESSRIGFRGHSHWSKILFSYFSDGSVEDALLEELRPSLEDANLRLELNERRDRVDRLVKGSLRDTGKELRDEVADILERFSELVSASDLRDYIGVIENFGHEGEHLWEIWLKNRNLLNFSNSTILRLREVVPHSYHQILPELDIMDENEVDPISYFVRLRDPASSFDGERELPALAQWNSEQWKGWLIELSGDDETKLYPLFEVLREAVGNKIMGGLKGAIATNLEQALISLANENDANRWRIQKYFPGLIEENE